MSKKTKNGRNKRASGQIGNHKENKQDRFTQSARAYAPPDVRTRPS